MRRSEAYDTFIGRTPSGKLRSPPTAAHFERLGLRPMLHDNWLERWLPLVGEVARLAIRCSAPLSEAAEPNLRHQGYCLEKRS